MEINSYLDKMKNIHKRILEFIEKEGNSEKDYQIMIDFLNNLKPKLNRNELKELLHLITKTIIIEILIFSTKSNEF